MYKLSLVISGLFMSCIAISQNTQPLPTDTLEGKSLQEVEIRSALRSTSKIQVSTEATASPASVTLLGRDYIAQQSIISYGDLLRPLAGVNVSNYNLGGVGYGIQMRGYVVTEHARDIAFFIDGVPQNQGSSIEANGYVDLRTLIPEDIRRFEVIRGPFSPFYGDHALGGSIAFETMDKMPSSLTITGGTYGYIKGLATVGFGKSFNTGYVSIEGSQMDDYRNNNGEKHVNGFAKYSFRLSKGIASVRAQAYTSDFGSAGYLTRSDVDSGKLSKVAAISPSDGGRTQQQNFVFNYKGSDTTNFTSISAYVQHHDFMRIRTIVTGGAQREERDSRLWAGFDVRHTRITRLGSIPFLYAGGIYFRGDGTVDTRYVTQDRLIVSQNKDKNIHTYTPAAYVQFQMQPAPKFKITLGARYDLLFYNIATGSTDTDTANLKTEPHTSSFSPKVGLAYGIVQGVNIFVNVAQGFKAPSGYEDYPFNSNLSVSKLTSYEIGIGGDNATGKLHGLVSAYLSDQKGEIQTNPFGNLTNFGKTRRSGIEAEGRAVLTPHGGLSIFANYTCVIAKIRNGGEDNTYVTNTPQSAAVLGFDYDFGAAVSADNRLVLSVSDQFVGKKNLNTLGSIQSDPYQRISGKLSYYRKRWGNFKLFAEATYYPGNDALDEVSFLSGNVLLTAPQAPFTFQGGVRIPF